MVTMPNPYSFREVVTARRLRYGTKEFTIIVRPRRGGRSSDVQVWYPDASNGYELAVGRIHLRDSKYTVTWRDFRNPVGAPRRDVVEMALRRYEYL